MKKSILLIISILVYLNLFSQEDNRFKYVDKNNLYYIKIPATFIPMPKISESEEIHFILPSISIDKKNPSVFFLSTNNIDSAQTLEMYLFFRMGSLLKDNNNSNINGTSVYETSKYKGQAMVFNTHNTCDMKTQIVFIKSADKVFEFIFTASENDFINQFSTINNIINTFTLITNNCKDGSIAKIGTFKPEGNSETLIMRDEKFNTEYFNKTQYVKTSINWLNSCEYELHFIESKPKNLLPFKETEILHIQITNVGIDWYECIWEIAGMKGFEKYSITK